MASPPIDSACDIAMDRAILLARQAEQTNDPAARYATAHLAQVYVSMARELRLGVIKSRKYSYVEAPGIPPQVVEPAPVDNGGQLPQDLLVEAQQ